MNTKNVNKLVIIPLVFILVLTLSITYALFAKNVNTNNRNIILSSINKYIGIYGPNKNNIELNKDYTFTIENRGTIDAGYELYMETDSNDDLSKITYTISGDVQKTGTLSDRYLLEGNLIPNEKNTITIRLTSEDISSYSGKVKVNTTYYKYAITYDLAGGVQGANTPITYTEIDDVSIPKPTKAGYAFTGWSGTGLSSNTDDVTFKNQTGARSYTANWIAVSSLNKTLNYTGNYQVYNINATGTYQITLYGAQGGNSGGKGASTTGKIKLKRGTNLYVYVGGAGSATPANVYKPTNGGYNGGGGSDGQDCCNRSFGTGGGATDIRYYGDGYIPTANDLVWNSTLGLNSRIMVAAGGGGRLTDGTANSIAGAGGTLIGGSASGDYVDWCYGTGGTQISGGTIGIGSGSNCAAGTFSGYTDPGTVNGAFGIGGKHGSQGNNSTGGGGGYYGGGSSGHIASAGGGSSFISGHTGCVAITSKTDRTPKAGCTTGTTNNSCSIHYSNMKFTETSMTAGVRTSNGQAIITFVSQ